MTDIITKYIEEDRPVIFAKFGDGEYYCASGHDGENCDRDKYTERLRNGLINSMKYLSGIKDAYLGRWHTDEAPNFFQSLTQNPINWINYHVFVIDDETFQNDHKVKIYKAIQNSHRKKIFIANDLMVKANILLNITSHVIVPQQNWFELHFDGYLSMILEQIGDDETPMILTACGMGAKVLIAELHKRKPNGIYLDIGSGLDYLCTKRSSRGHNMSYDAIASYFSSILPPNWNDPSYDWIYPVARHKLGLHLG